MRAHASPARGAGKAALPCKLALIFALGGPTLGALNLSESEG
jgi:hypothetical protein